MAEDNCTGDLLLELEATRTLVHTYTPGSWDPLGQNSPLPFLRFLPSAHTLAWPSLACPGLAGVALPGPAQPSDEETTLMTANPLT